MRPITKYVAKDGLEFTDSTDCIQHELNCSLLVEIMSSLPTAPDGVGYEGGEGFLQHDEQQFLAVQDMFLDHLKRYTNNESIEAAKGKRYPVGMSIVGRLVDDCCPGSVSKHWYRIMCTDRQFREWGQPYFAINPGTGTELRLNQ